MSLLLPLNSPLPLHPHAGGQQPLCARRRAAGTRRVRPRAHQPGDAVVAARGQRSASAFLPAGLYRDCMGARLLGRGRGALRLHEAAGGVAGECGAAFMGGEEGGMLHLRKAGGATGSARLLFSKGEGGGGEDGAATAQGRRCCTRAPKASFVREREREREQHVFV
eukprot:6373-Chlamydomonas_euryale.AAC.1